MVAEAHVKWFAPCNTSDNPIPLSAALTSAFWLFVVLYCGAWSAALAPLASGTALLAIVFLYLHGFAHALVRVRTRGFRHAWRGRRVALQRHE